jgi:hypothetical protein
LNFQLKNTILSHLKKKCEISLCFHLNYMHIATSTPWRAFSASATRAIELFLRMTARTSADRRPPQAAVPPHGSTAHRSPQADSHRPDHHGNNACAKHTHPVAYEAHSNVALPPQPTFTYQHIH